MKLRDGILEALEACSIPYALDDWAPLKPPQQGCYATVADEVETFGDDRLDAYCFAHSTWIELYDEGFDEGRAKRDALMLALSENGVGCARMRPVYDQSTKKFKTVYEIDEYTTKESEQ